jgi:hypothetical protein
VAGTRGGRGTLAGVALAAAVLAGSIGFGQSAGAGTTTTTSSTSTTSTTTLTSTTTTTTTLPQYVVEPPTGEPSVSRGPAWQATPTLPEPTTTTTLPPDPTILPANSGTGYRVVYSKSRQRVWAVDSNDVVLKTHLVSGRLTWNQPLPGTYSVFSRSMYTCNIDRPYICWRYMVRFTQGPDGDNIGFHEIPVNTNTGQPVQSTSQLGTALSGGCVRQATPDAQFIWSFAPVGTKVVVVA